MTGLARLLTVLATLAPATVAAHDFWIEPATFHPVPGSEVSVGLRVGEGLRGDPVPRMPARIERFLHRDGSGERPVAGRSGDDPAGSVRILGPGRQWLSYLGRPSPITLAAARFEAYLRAEGLEDIVAARARRGQSESPAREHFHRAAKALLLAGGTDPGAAQPAVATPLGLTLELVPERDPYALAPGDELTVRLLFRGQPVGGRLVMALAKSAPGATVSARTDRDGRATLRLAHHGLWLIKCVHMIAAPPDQGVDWESWWASLTFELGDGHGSTPPSPTVRVP